MDKAFWRQIVANSFAVPAGHTAVAFLPELMANLGSTDPELRDSLCYEILCAWTERGEFAPDTLREMMTHLMFNLRDGLSAGETDRVFRRTFSVLILGEIIDHDRRTPFLTGAEFAQVRHAGLRYLADETDLRGYVPQKGWAHSAAHTADLLRSLAANPRSGPGDHLAILEAVRAKLLAATGYVYVDKEEYRLGRAVLAVLRRDLLPVADLAAWIQSLGKSLVFGQDNVRNHNLSSFLAALHLFMTDQELPADVKPVLLAEIHRAVKPYFPRFA